MSQSLWNRAMSYDKTLTRPHQPAGAVSIPLEQGNVLRRIYNHCIALHKSQSLWNRAMSYDITEQTLSNIKKVSIPLEQGNVLRLK